MNNGKPSGISIKYGSAEVGTESPARAKKRVHQSDNAPVPLESCLDNALRVASALCLARSNLRAHAPIRPQRGPLIQSMRSQGVTVL